MLGKNTNFSDAHSAAQCTYTVSYRIFIFYAFLVKRYGGLGYGYGVNDGLPLFSWHF